MADKIKGITVEIGGDTTGLGKALQDTNKEINSTQKELKEVEKLLKLDPTNTTLLAQKQELLGKQVSNTTTKLDALKQAKDKAEKSGDIDKNTKEYRNLERQIVATEQSLNKLAGEAGSSEKSLDKLGKEVENASDKVKNANEGFTVFKGVMANLATDAIKGAIGTIAKLGSTLVDVGKQAVQSYADYEQLVGGIETLFGKDAGIVEDYANNAFKTAGLNANEYMETVTSFSASLLQSLDQDTAKSAQVADMAIVDMADNANKMGTSMEMIQNAYQGFAKQNYTMLDNLKLGYGGTKTEMERLLEDAEKLSGQKYDISSLSDVYEAIHVIQTEMGITGTTAKEASETLSGSLSAMQSAWANMLVGIADENSDFDTLVNNLVDSVITASNNFIPRVEAVINGITNLIIGLAPRLLPKILEIGGNLIVNLVAGIQDNLPILTTSALDIITVLLSSILTMLPQILQMGIDVITNLALGIAEQLPTLIPLAIEAILNLVITLLDNIDMIIDAGIQLIMGLANGLIEALPVLIEKIPVIIDKLVGAIVDNLPMLVIAALQLMIALAEGIVTNIPELLKAIPKVITSLVNAFKKYVSNYKDIGKMMIQGIFDGISNATQWLYDKLKGWVNNVMDFVKGLFGIESPSKVFRDEIGKNMALGIGVGFGKTMPGVISDMKSSLSCVTDTMSQIAIGDIPETNNKITTQNFYTTKHMTATTEVVRQPTEVILEVDKREVGRVVVPAYNRESNRIGVVMA